MADNSNFQHTFNRLKQILTPYSSELVVELDVADNYYLNTHFVMKNKKPMYFGSVKINKKYVSYHLMPVYVFPELLKMISPTLKRRMQGKSCFNFTAIDNSLAGELEKLTQAGYQEYNKAGYL